MAESYRELAAWKKAMELVTEIYQLTRTFPREEVYGLTSQLRRAAVSVPSNIAEGKGRWSKGEYRQFLSQARGSLLEAETQILIGLNLNYLSQAKVDAVLEKSAEVGRILNGLMSSMCSQHNRYRN